MGRSPGAAQPLGDVAELNLALRVGGRRGRVRFFPPSPGAGTGPGTEGRRDVGGRAARGRGLGCPVRGGGAESGPLLTRGPNGCGLCGLAPPSPASPTPRPRGVLFPGPSPSRPLDVSVPLSVHFWGFVFVSAAALSPASVSPASVTSQALVPETRGPASAPPQPGESGEPRADAGERAWEAEGGWGAPGSGAEFAAPSGLRNPVLGGE